MASATWTRTVARRATATPWIALFAVLVLAQTAHLFEHVAQMVQLHVLAHTGASARGIVGQLDIEWVHFLWNAGVVVALAILLVQFGANRWLIVATAFASWHLVEHDVIMQAFLATGIPGSPGLLSTGGLILGGLPLARPDLHFVYNLIEASLIALAFVSQLRRDVGTAWPRPLPS